MDIKVDRFTDMVVERLKKNNREADEKVCETPEEKDTKQDEQNNADKPRGNEGKGEKHADGVDRIGRRVPVSTILRLLRPRPLRVNWAR